MSRQTARRELQRRPGDAATTSYLVAALLLLATPAAAQHQGHGTPAAPPRPAAQDPHAGHGAAPAPAPDPHAGHGAAPGQIPPGHVEITLPPDRQQLIGLRTARAERATLAGEVRASAVIAADESRLANVHSKLMGWVQELHVKAVGETVTAGQPLYSLYSQELFAAQQEYLRARAGNRELAAAARQRLRLWDVPEDQLALIQKSGPQRAIVFQAPASGTVIEKNVVEGQFIEAEMPLFAIADLSQVWVLAEVYEYEVGNLDPRGRGEVQLQGLATPLHAPIDHVYPTVDPRTRTVRVRLVLPNPDGQLRPGTFATVLLPTRPVEAIWVPDEAVIDTGVRKVVYLALGDGRFRPVEVRAGRRAEGHTEILEGIAEGAEVVVSAQFLLDSESRLRGLTAPGPGHGGH